MKLDRNIPAGHGNKYGLIKNRELEKTRNANGYFPDKIADALLVLVDAGILDWGATPETEFFAIRLKDRYARVALHSYADEAHRDGNTEYAEQVHQLTARSGVHHPSCKRPD